MAACLCCGVETSNPKFCSRSCSAVVTNKFKKKRARGSYPCRDCGAQKLTRRHTYCQSCYLAKSEAFGKEPIGSLVHRNHHRSSAFALIRARARKEVSHTPNVCAICGYDKHIEICHIKAISEFEESTPINVVNSVDNLVKLCPNHHWEFDSGLISLR